MVFYLQIFMKNVNVSLQVCKKNRDLDNTVKKLFLSGVDPTGFFDKIYAVWLDFKSATDNILHGSGRKIVSFSEGISVEIEREAGGYRNRMEKKSRTSCILTYGKNAKREEAGKKLAEKNKEMKLFTSKIRLQLIYYYNYRGIIIAIGVLFYLYCLKPVPDEVPPEVSPKPEPETPRKSKHILYE